MERIRRTRRRSLILLAIMTAVINIPLVHSEWTQYRLNNNGEVVIADVTDTLLFSPDDNPRYLVEFGFPEALDPDERRWTAAVDEATYDVAEEAGTIRTRVLPEDPAVHEVAGQSSSNLGWILAMSANAVLLALIVLYWRTRPTPPAGPLRLRAIGDVITANTASGASVEMVASGTYQVIGRLAAITDERIVIESDDRAVEVDLAGHGLRAAFGQSAQVLGEQAPKRSD